MKRYILIFLAILVLFTAFYAQADTAQYNPTLLPTSNFYFMKEWWRSAREFLIRDPAAKASFGLKVLEEKAAEAKKVFEKNPDDIDVMKAATANYTAAKERLELRLEGLKNNPNVEELVQKIEEQIKRHDEVLLKDLTLRVIRQKAEEQKQVSQSALESNGQIIQNDEEKIKKSQDAEEDVDEPAEIADCSQTPLLELAAPPAGCRWDIACVDNIWKAKMICDDQPGSLAE